MTYSRKPLLGFLVALVALLVGCGEGADSVGRPEAGATSPATRPNGLRHHDTLRIAYTKNFDLFCLWTPSTFYGEDEHFTCDFQRFYAGHPGLREAPMGAASEGSLRNHDVVTIPYVKGFDLYCIVHPSTYLGQDEHFACDFERFYAEHPDLLNP